MKKNKVVPLHILLRRFENGLTSFINFLQTKKIFVACSGGSDSVALAHLLKNCSVKFNIGIFHVHHGMRGTQANQDESFVRQLAQNLKIPFDSKRLKDLPKKAKQAKKSLEETARETRYQTLIDLAKHHGVKVIALAHTQDDQAETILMRLLQGTGLRGLCGIRSSLKWQGVTFIRPLLTFTKKELLSYLAQNKLKFRHDRSNFSTKFLRNKIRHKLIPSLKREYNPRIIEALARLPVILEEEQGMVKDLENQAWPKVLRQSNKSELKLNRRTLSQLPAGLQYRLISRALQTLEPASGLNFEAWQRLRPMLGLKRFRYSLPRDIDLELTASSIKLYKKK